MVVHEKSQRVLDGRGLFKMGENWGCAGEKCREGGKL